MAIPSSFQDRLRKLEETRNQRLSLLQAEKDLQSKKSNLLQSKFTNIRISEKRCLILERIIAASNFDILARKSEIERLDMKYDELVSQFRTLKSEVEETEEKERERDGVYEGSRTEMRGFVERVEKRGLEVKEGVLEMRRRNHELKYALQEFQGNIEYMNNSEIAAAEAQKAQLLLVKDNLERTLASNYQLRALLQKQLYKNLKSQDQEKR